MRPRCKPGCVGGQRKAAGTEAAAKFEEGLGGNVKPTGDVLSKLLWYKQTYCQYLVFGGTVRTAQVPRAPLFHQREPRTRVGTLEQRAVEICAFEVCSAHPGIAPWRDFVIGGGLMSYGPNKTEIYKSGAQILARVLKGDKPGNIPVVRPAAELVISQRNAKHLGVTLPQSIVSKAKEMLT